jgi:metal-responsive CopG/Arc/MetJ family transcriptional regulator
MLWSTLHSVQTIQVVLEDSLLKLADRAARRAKVNRSALFREALREHLKRLETLEKERRDRVGYERTPATEFDVWNKVAAWPEE